MERHERYDPEDIESLLSQRAFDELLPDERAFVLRHLSGRDEYERMRALLHYVRPDERDRGTIEPEDRVRTNVLATFRAQQQPQWRVWLNGISLWLAPKETPAVWRPALAFGSLALLVVAGVVAVQQFGNASREASVAEVKHEERTAPAKLEAEKKVRPSVGEPNTAKATEVQPQRAEQAPVVTDAATAHGDREVAEHVAEEARYMPAAEAEDMAILPSKADPSPATAVTFSDSESMSHTVTANELSRNATISNTGSEVAYEIASKAQRRKLIATADQHTTASRSMADDPAILGIVAAGW